MVGAGAGSGVGVSRGAASMTTIRTAIPDDAAALAALRWEFRGGRQPLVESQADFLARCTAWMRRELEGPRWHAWVADRNGGIAGQVWLQILEKLPNPNGEGRRHGYISNLFVQPSARGGVGTRLLDAALDHARAAGVDRVVLWPSARSVTLYARRGFTRDGGVIELKL